MNSFEKLDELYKSLPTVQCKRLCQECCDPIMIPKIEAHRLGEKRGYLDTTRDVGEPRNAPWLPDPDLVRATYIGLEVPITMRTPFPPIIGDCQFLEPRFAKCTAYQIRPLVCRIWGCMDKPEMRCRFGCVPTRWISEEEHKRLCEKVIAIQQEWEKEKKL